MALIKCKECGTEFSDLAPACPKCACPISAMKENNTDKDNTSEAEITKDNSENIFIVKENNTDKDNTSEEEITKDSNEDNFIIKEEKKKKRIKKWPIILIIIAIIIGIFIYLYFCTDTFVDKRKIVEENCRAFTANLKVYIDNKDFEGFDSGWFDHDTLSLDKCETISCSCPSAWELFLDKRILEADSYLEQGLISSAYKSLGSNYIEEYSKLKDYYNEHEIFKILPTKQKESVTGLYPTFAEWQWEYQVNGGFSFNKRYVNYASSYLTLKFGDYFDDIIVSGHLASAKHPNWSNERNIAVHTYDYKILDNKIYMKLEDEDDSQYDALFEIVSLTDTELRLKLLINTTDVNAGQIYVMEYKKS